MDELGVTRLALPPRVANQDQMREKMLKETKFWLGYISVFVILTLFVAGLLESIEWATKLLKEPVISPIYLAAGGICAFLACLKLKGER